MSLRNMYSTDTDYYRIPTVDGDFYVYQETATERGYGVEGVLDRRYNYCIEPLTGLACYIKDVELDTSKPREKYRYNAIKDEIMQVDGKTLKAQINRGTEYFDYKNLKFYESAKLGS